LARERCSFALKERCRDPGLGAQQGRGDAGRAGPHDEQSAIAVDDALAQRAGHEQARPDHLVADARGLPDAAEFELPRAHPMGEKKRIGHRPILDVAVRSVCAQPCEPRGI
jgi:hypothetical protein